MKFTHYLSFIVFLLSMCLACKKNPYSAASSYTQQILAAKNSSVKDSASLVKLLVEFDREVDVEPEMRASVGLVTFYDSAYSILKEKKISHIEVTILDPNNQKYSFLYATNEVESFKEKMGVGYESIQAFVSTNAQKFMYLVDDTKLSAEEVDGLMAVSQKLQSVDTFEDFSIDGFRLEENMKIIHIGARSKSNNLPIKLSIQLDMNTNKITYFGVNDDL